jgi:hypothetical protein
VTPDLQPVKPAIYESALAVKEVFVCFSFELAFITHTPPLLTELPFPGLPAGRPAAPRLCGSFLRAAAALDVFSFNAVNLLVGCLNSGHTLPFQTLSPPDVLPASC